MLTVYFGDESPQSIPGLKAWYDATTINQADNTSVTTWRDQSGNEAHMYQSTTAAQPTLQTNELNGRPVVRFDGTDDFMNLTAPFDFIPLGISSTNSNCCSPNGDYFVQTCSSASPQVVIYKKSGNNFNKLSNLSSLPSSTINSCNFSNNNTYLAIASNSSPYINIYKRSGDTFTKLSNPAVLPAGSAYYSQFTSDDNYLIVSHATSPFITVYSVDKLTDTFTKISNPASLPTGPVWCAESSINSNYIACGQTSIATKFLEIYSFSGGTLTKLSDPTTLPTVEVYSISWLDDQTFAIGFAGGTSQIWIYKYDSGTSTFQRLTTFSTGLANHYSIKYSRNKNYLLLAGSSYPYFKVYSVSGTTYTAINLPDSLPTGTGRGASWGINDTSILISHGTAPYIQAYSFDGTTLTNLTKLNMFRNVGGGTVFQVIKYNVTALNSQSGFVASMGTNANASRFLTGWQLASGKPHNGGRRLDTDTFQNVLATTTATTTFYMQTALINYSNSDASVFINGKLENTNTSFQTDGLTSDTNSLGIYLGNVGNTEWLNGDIAEVIVYNRALSNNEIKVIHQYLSKKWGIALVP